MKDSSSDAPTYLEGSSGGGNAPADGDDEEEEEDEDEEKSETDDCDGNLLRRRNFCRKLNRTVRMVA